MALLDAILEGLTGPTGGSLRDLCAEAACEFLEWSAKHIHTRQPKEPAGAKAVASRTNLNAGSLLRRLMDRLVHPDAYQRCAPLQLQECPRWWQLSRLSGKPVCGRREGGKGGLSTSECSTSMKILSTSSAGLLLWVC